MSTNKVVRYFARIFIETMIEIAKDQIKELEELENQIKKLKQSIEVSECRKD